MIVTGVRHLWRTLRALPSNSRLFLIGTFLMGIGNGAVWVHMNLYFHSVGIGETMIGRILSAGSIGVVLVSLPAAMWIDRIRAERILLLCSAGFGVFFLLQLMLPEPGFLMASSLIAGMFFTVHRVAAAPFFMRNTRQEHRTELFGISSAVETLATVVSAYGIGELARVLSLRFGSEVLGLRGALAVAAVASISAGVPFSLIRSKPFAEDGRGWRDYVYSRDMSLILKLALPGFLVGCGAGLTIPFLNLYFRNRFDQGPAEIGFYFSIAQTITMLCFLLGPIVARRFSHVRAIVATELLSIPFFFLLAVADQLWVAVLAFWMRGALMNMNQPVSSAFGMEIVPEKQQALANSVRTFAWNLSWMLTAPLGGWLIERHGFGPNMFATMGCYLMAASLFWIFFRGHAVAGNRGQSR